MTKVYCVNCIYCGEPKHDDKLETVFVCEKLSQYNDKSDYFSIKKEIAAVVYCHDGNKDNCCRHYKKISEV